MCGIAGIASLDARRAVDGLPLTSMLACVRHRGPDDQGEHIEHAVALGHRRLSVIDVEGGHQPLYGKRETTVAVINGEIYNYRQLARELRAAGSTFRTASDSEVAAHAYDVWGLDFVDRLDGMFALAVWDGERRRLVLARDRMGEKPLFHTTVDGLLLFASELSAILAHPSVTRDIDAAALREYLTLEYVPAPHCLVSGVHKLEPGTALVLENGVANVSRYWRLNPLPSDDPLPYPDAVAELRRRLEDSVTSRLVSDVPLGIFLSGGIDSSTIAALAARHGALETFSIGFEEASFDESAYARAVAAHIGSRHHERIVRSTEMPELVPRIGRVLDEPIGDASILPTMVLSRFAREHVTVALGGDGGDELFAGYPMHQGHRVAKAARKLPSAALNLLATAAGRIPVSHANFTFAYKLAAFLRGAAAAPPLNHALWLSSFAPAEHSSLLTKDVMAEAGAHDPLEVFRQAWSASAGAPLLARAAHLDATTYLPNDILTKVDRASMNVALEVRAPFLARDVVEFAFSLPDSYRMRGLRGKRILRDAARGLVPPGILKRPKKGFGMPVGAWLTSSLRDLTHDVLCADSIKATGWFHPAAVARLLDEHDRRVRDHRKPIWTLLVLELWRREHLVDVPLRVAAATK